ncbi:opioid growth factor receptor-like [Siphateles boraxobius]|uniref:opioid growth factor receptor-like n=1 Tax=Siphateles boraxobius TaxID=180520 RepID=UPI004062D937
MYFIKIWGVLKSLTLHTLTLFWRVIYRLQRLRYIRQINMESDDECELDSTWEEEGENKTTRLKNYKMRSRNMSAAKDMQSFRHSCQNLDDDDDDDNEDEDEGEGRFYNLEFYHGQIKSSPGDIHIDEFHQNWKGQYNLLEDCHYYIQWLFPIQERGVNWDAHVLTKKEIKVFRKDEGAKRKLVESYKLMLDFYGIRLVDETTGEVDRAHNWKDRFMNLNRYSHNNLRITRILKCLGTLGLQHYQAPLCKFFLHETLEKEQLQHVKQSVLDYFIFAVLDKSERRDLVRFAFKHFKPQEQFVWGPKKFLSGEVDSKNEENKDNNTAEHKEQTETDERTNEVNEIDDNNHVRSIENEINREKDQQAVDVQPVETGSVKTNKDEHDSDDKSQCSSGDNYVKENQELGVSDAK